MNVLVVGGAGYIGSICSEELLNAGHHVTVYDDLSEGHRSAVAIDQVVDHHGPVAGGRQLPHAMAANVTRAAHDKDIH